MTRSSATLLCLVVSFASGCTSCADGETGAADLGSTPDLAPTPDTAPAATPKPVMTLLAGRLGGRGHLDGTGPDARLDGDSPESLLHDQNGHLYFAEPTCIRKVDLAAKTVSTIAGRYNDASTVDGDATTARFNQITHLALDDAGHLFIAENTKGQYHVIRRLTLDTGVVTTFAGRAPTFGGETDDGPGLDATFADITSMTVVAGKLYVADGGLRSIDLATAVVATEPTPTLNRVPRKIAAGAADRIVACVEGELTSSLATFATTTGDWTYLPSFDDKSNYCRPLAFHAGRVLFADNDSESVREYDVATGTSELRSWTYDRPNSPGAHFDVIDSIAIGPEGVYAIQGSDHVIAKAVVGETSTKLVVGLPAGEEKDRPSEFARDFYSLAFDGDKTVYLAGATGKRMVAVDLETKTTREIPRTPIPDIQHYGAFGSAGPGKLIVAAGQVYPSALYELDLATGEYTLLAGDPLETGRVDGAGATARMVSVLRIEKPRNGKVRFLDDSLLREIDLATKQVKTLSKVFMFTEFVSEDDDHVLVFCKTPSSSKSDPILYRLTLSTRALELIVGDSSERASFDGNEQQARLVWPDSMSSDGAGGVVFFDPKRNDAPALRTYQPATGMVQTLFDSGGYGVRLGGKPSTSRVSGSSIVAVGPHELVMFDQVERVLLHVAY